MISLQATSSNSVSELNSAKNDLSYLKGKSHKRTYVVMHPPNAGSQRNLENIIRTVR